MGIRNLKIETDEIRRKRAKKKREKERKKRRIHKFGQTPLKHARRGQFSCFFAAASGFLTMLIFTVSYHSRGNVNIFIGFAGIMALVLAGLGLYRGIEGFKERNKNYLTCKIGVGCNGILLLSFVVTFIRGLF